MRSLLYTPSAPLSTFVRCFWYSEGAPRTHRKERLLPTGETSVIFNLRDEPIRIYDARDPGGYTTYGPAILSGARARSFVIDTQQQDRVAGVQFAPAGAFPFFRPPASEFEGATTGLEDLWSRQAADIRDRLLAARAPKALLVELERCLLEQLVRPLELHPAVSYSLEQFAHPAQSTRVAAVTDRIGLSPRRFIELFRRQTGLAPKVFFRVRRFQQALQTVHRRKDIDWARVALDCGYYDQPHFIHDFQSFSGLTPTAYAAAVTPHLNHVPLP